MKKEAVLLINLGTPDNPQPSAVRRYLSQFLNDARVIDINPVGRFFLVNFIIIPFRSFRSSALYRKIWTREGSPLLLNSQELCSKLQKKLGENYHVALAMRYQSPSIRAELQKLRALSPSRIHVIPLYPQYASSSTGSTLEEVFTQMRKWQVIPSLNIISEFYQHPAFLRALYEKARQYDLASYDHIVFSYHGLPERQILKATAEYGKFTCSMGTCCDTISDRNRYCYRAACMSTSRSLAQMLNIGNDRYTTSFQSRLDDKWLKPYSDKVVEDLARNGKKRVLVFSPAFVADCLETIYEIGEEYNEIFRSHGGEKITLVESLNADDTWVEAVREIVLS